jgi:hypothetical protein
MTRKWFFEDFGHLKGDLIPERGQILREVGIPHLSLENYKKPGFLKLVGDFLMQGFEGAVCKFWPFLMF